jgi:hypothetical protein
MATTSAADAQLIELLELVRNADSVELKLTVPLADQRAAVQALGLDPLDAQIRLVHFFDTPDLALQDAGVVVRARRIQGRSDDSVVKLRPIEPGKVPDDLRESPAFVVEVDAMPGGHVCSGSLKGVPRKATVQEVAAGNEPLRKLLSKEQRAFYAEHAPSGVGLDDLVLLGPIFVLKIKGTPPGFDRRMVVELWLYPDGSRILELSTKCAPTEALQVAGEARAFLVAHGVEVLGDQQTKTRTALEYFAEQLGGAARAPSDRAGARSRGAARGGGAARRSPGRGAAQR